MKTLTKLIEVHNNLVSENYESNPGNNIKQGVTNHLTPISNIITNIRNLFATIMQIIVEPCEDGSCQIHSQSPHAPPPLRILFVGMPVRYSI